MNCQIKAIATNPDKTMALKLLRQRKTIEKFISGMHDKRSTLEQLLLNIEDGMNNKAIFDTLKVANEAT